MSDETETFKQVRSTLRYAIDDARDFATLQLLAAEATKNLARFMTKRVRETYRPNPQSIDHRGKLVIFSDGQWAGTLPTVIIAALEDATTDGGDLEIDVWVTTTAPPEAAPYARHRGIFAGFHHMDGNPKGGIAFADGTVVPFEDVVGIEF